MKRNLFVILLAVMLVAAVVFVVTPDAKASNELITAQEDGETITVSAANTVLDLNGKKNVVIKIEGGVELAVIDTSFIVDEETLDLTGTNAGTLTVDTASTGTIAPVAFHGDFRYLAIEENGTYSFHPFNLAISKLGINTIGETICIRVSFIANDVVKSKLSDYGLKGISGETAAFSAKENYAFGDKNGIQAYFDLTGSFDADKLDVTCKYQAYMVINGVDVLSNYIAEITPREVLKTLNASDLTPTDTQKAAIETIAANNAHLADLFTRITGAQCTHNAKAEATCQKASVCKNCGTEIGTTVECKDDNADNKCDWCGTVLVVEDYYTFGPEEMIIAKSGTITYAPHDTQIDGKDVYKLLSNGWSGEIWASTTSHLLNDENIHSLTTIRAELAKKQYQYATVTFQLSEGAKIGLYHTVPKLSDAFVGESAGFVFTAGGTLTHNGRYIEADYGDRFAVYSNGKQVKLGDPINAGQWYTFVCQLNLDTSITLNGASTFLNIGLTNGNNKPVYVSEVRYYTNDTYKEDYVYEIVVPDYDEKDATELVEQKTKTQNVYSNQGTIFGRDNVYGATFLSNWNVEIVAKTTVSKALYADSAFGSWTDVRANYKASGYEYVAIDFALSEGATIRAIGCLPPATQGGAVVTAGLTFTDGKALAWGGNCTTDEQKAFFAVYSNGKEVKVGDTVKAGQWYTVVIKLLSDITGTKDGEASWSNVAFNVGNSKMVYFSNVRYYRNDSYKTDYVYETVDPDYDEKDATEIVVYKNSPHENYDQKNITIYDRTDVYGVIFQSDWNVEAVAKTTAANSSMPAANSGFATWTDVRNNYKAQGYQYVAIDFALSEGAQIRAIGCVPPTVAGGKVNTTGLNFIAGKPLAWASTCETDEQRSYFTVYSNGKEVKVGDTINAGQWYTVVIKLLLNGNEFSQGENGWSSVAFNVGNGKMVYFSNVRYYRNDSFATDFAG